MPYVDEFNTFEAGLWLVFAVITAIAGARVRGMTPRVRIGLVFLFGAFGFSDLVERSTGAWWRPPWLLALKGTCLAGFLICGLVVWRNRAGARGERLQEASK